MSAPPRGNLDARAGRPKGECPLPTSYKGEDDNGGLAKEVNENSELSPGQMNSGDNRRNGQRGSDDKWAVAVVLAR